jgi:argininosuccinate synthase
MAAHTQLEELVLDRDTLAYKKGIGDKFADVVYEGKWFTPLREALQAFVESTQQYVTGTVKLKLYKGNIIKAGTTSPYSLYNESIASFTTGDLYYHRDASGFINLFGLSLKVRAMMLDAAKKSGNPISDDIYMGDAIINNPESVFDKADVKLNEQYQKTADKVAEIEAKKN